MLEVMNKELHLHCWCKQLVILYTVLKAADGVKFIIHHISEMFKIEFIGCLFPIIRIFGGLLITLLKTTASYPITVEVIQILWYFPPLVLLHLIIT